MKVLFVIAHPLEQSLCSRLSDCIYGKLVERGHEVAVENLYQDRFDPCLSVAERESYYTAPYDASGVERNIRSLLEAEALVLVFPTWWFGFPAILKGWFDRVWAPTFAYEHGDNFGPIRPRLGNLKQTLVVTTLGASWWVDFFVLRNPLKRIIKFGLLGACARNCRLKYMSFYKCEQVDTERLKAITSKVERAVCAWF